MMAYEGSERTQDNFKKFIDQFQPETRTFIKKLERVLNKLYKKKLTLLFNETCLNERLQPYYTYIHTYIHTHTHTHTHIYIYIYIYIYIHRVCVYICCISVFSLLRFHIM